MSYSRRSRYSRSPSPYKRSSRSVSGSLSRSRSRSRSAESDVENPGNSLYVTGLSPRVTKRELEKHFASEGDVIDVHLVVDPRTRESRGFGFVTMATNKEADRCIKYLDRSVLEGRVIMVEKFLWQQARRRRGRTPTPGRYLGLRTVRVRHRSPSYSPRRSQSYSRSRSPSSSRSRSQSYSPRYSYFSRSRYRYSRSPDDRYYRSHCYRSYSPEDRYYRRRDRSYSPDDHYYRRRDRFYSPPYDRSYRRRDRSYSPYYRYSPDDWYYRRRDHSYSPYDRSYRRRDRSYSPYDRYSPDDRYYRRRHSSYSPYYYRYDSPDDRYHRYKRPHYRSVSQSPTPPVSRRASRRSNSYSVSPNRNSSRSCSRSTSPVGRRSRSHSQSISSPPRKSSRSPRPESSNDSYPRSLHMIKGAEEVFRELEKRVRAVPIYPVCAVLEEGISELKAGLKMLVDGDEISKSLRIENISVD